MAGVSVYSLFWKAVKIIELFISFLKTFSANQVHSFAESLEIIWTKIKLKKKMFIAHFVLQKFHISEFPAESVERIRWY